jgi:hypothetical protein
MEKIFRKNLVTAGSKFRGRKRKRWKRKKIGGRGNRDHLQTGTAHLQKKDPDRIRDQMPAREGGGSWPANMGTDVLIRCGSGKDRPGAGKTKTGE